MELSLGLRLTAGRDVIRVGVRYRDVVIRGGDERGESWGWDVNWGGE